MLNSSIDLGRSDRCYLHLHIPRCAGSSFHLQVYGLFPRHNVIPYGDDTIFQFARCQHRSPVLVTGHFAFGQLAPVGFRCKYLILLREPNARLKSLYQFIRDTPQHRLYHHFTQPTYTLTRALMDRAASRQFENGQIRQVLGMLSPDASAVGQRELDLALTQLRRDDVIVGLVEQYPDFVDRFRADLTMSGWKAQATDVKQVRINESHKEDCPEDPVTEQLIRKHNQLDLELYCAVKTDLGC